MGRYEGLDPKLRTRVQERDKYRCRWCGRTNVGCDPHHIRYRRGAVDDDEGNLIMLCRRCHGFVHGDKNAKGESILKWIAQALLWELIELPGVTGMALWRQKKAEWAREGLCDHGQPPGSCVCSFGSDEHPNDEEETPHV